MENKKISFLIISFIIILYLLTLPLAVSGEEQTRIQKCLKCCTEKHLICLNLNPDRRLCAAELQNCIATCKSQGQTPSNWSECWIKSGQ